MHLSPQLLDNRKPKFPAEYRDHLWYPAFRSFHKDNPHILVMIIGEIFRAREVGIKKVSIKQIIGHIRWTETIRTQANDGYKINDAYTSLYAIVVSSTYPEWSDMFEQRELRSLPNDKIKTTK